MRVIGAGFGRTGTLSLKRALEDLGFGPTYHMEETIRRPSHIRRWLRYARTGEVDWDALFSGFGSGVDFPVSCAWEELASHYPDAKVVLSVRDPQQWWASTESTIYRFRTVFPGWLLRLVPTTRYWLEMTDRLVWDGIFGGQFADRDHAVDVFERHVDHVRATCPPERLLVFDVAEGWEPLCAFLDVPIPPHPFPHLNDAKAMRRRIAGLRWGTRAAPIVVASGAAVGLGVRARRRRARRAHQHRTDRQLRRADRARAGASALPGGRIRFRSDDSGSPSESRSVIAPPGRRRRRRHGEARRDRVRDARRRGTGAGRAGRGS